VTTRKGRLASIEGSVAEETVYAEAARPLGSSLIRYSDDELAFIEIVLNDKRRLLFAEAAGRITPDVSAVMRKQREVQEVIRIRKALGSETLPARTAVAPTEAVTPVVRGAAEAVEPGRPTFSVITPEQQAGFPPRIPPTRRPVSGGRFDDAMRRSNEQISLKEPKEPLITQARRGIPFLQQTVFDDLYPLARFVAAAKKFGAALSTAENPYLVARLLKGVGGKINTFIETGTFGKRNWKIVDGQTVPDFKGPGLYQILQPIREGKKYEDFVHYFTTAVISNWLTRILSLAFSAVILP